MFNFSTFTLNNCCMYWLVSYWWVYTLFLLQIATQSLTNGECNYFGVTIVTLGMTPVVSGARMLMYGPACPCMCLQASVHSCSAGPCTPVYLENTSPQSKLKLILTIILQKYLINFNCVVVNLHYVCIHPSMHLCPCVCVYAFATCVCMHLYI